MRLALATVACLAALAGTSDAAKADPHRDHGASSYAGQEMRAIKSLSEADIHELRQGGGWGLAKAAEFNGVPGPAHLLELQHEIGLAPEQVTALEAIFVAMRAEAIERGERLIELEQALERHFAAQTITEPVLRDLLSRIAETYGDLRYVHLVAHLETLEIVSPEQVHAYNALRGYGTGGVVPGPHGGHTSRGDRPHSH
jgi:hypothetical protein